MTMQTRRIARRSAKFFRATGKAYMVTACCGLVLLSAVAAHAAAPFNGLPFNGMPYNGIDLNGMPYNGMPMNGHPYNGIPLQGRPMNELLMNGTAANGASYSSKPSTSVQNENLPWATLSHQGLGKSPHQKTPGGPVVHGGEG